MKEWLHYRAVAEFKYGTPFRMDGDYFEVISLHFEPNLGLSDIDRLPAVCVAIGQHTNGNYKWRELWSQAYLDDCWNNRRDGR